MWLFFGVLAIILTVLHFIWMFLGRETKWFRHAALAFTALTLCAFYQMDAVWVRMEDWSALMDVTPTMSKMLWGLTAASILLNSVSLFKKSAH